jgi:hypothetical protein
MSGTLATSVITNVGNTEIITNSTSAAGISIAYAEIGSANISTLTALQLQALTAVSGLVYSSTSSSSVLTYNASPSENLVSFKIVLDETIGPFSIGNIGLFDNNNNLIAITALTNTETKIASSVTGPGNRKNYTINLAFSNAATITNFTVLNENASSIPVVANETLLPPASSAVFNLYLVQSHTKYNKSCLAATYGGVWHYILLDGSNYPEGAGAFNVPGMFASGVNPGDAVYFNGTLNQFSLANSGNSFTQAPVGIKGYGDYLYPHGSVFVSQNATAYTTGGVYYCTTAGTSPNISSIASPIPVGVAITPGKLYVNLGNYNFSSTGNFAIYNGISAGSTSFNINNNQITVNSPFIIESGLTVNSTPAEPLFIINNGNTAISANIYNDGTYYREQFVANGTITNEIYVELLTGKISFDLTGKGSTFGSQATFTGGILSDGPIVTSGAISAVSGAVTIAGGILSESSIVSNGEVTVNNNLSVTGSVAVNGVLTAANGTSGNEVVNLSQFIISEGVGAGFTLPTNVTVFYGSGSTNTSGDGNVTFPQPFSVGPIYVGVQVAGNTNGDHGQPLNVTANGFGVYTVDGSGNTNGPQAFYWIAFGII